MMLIVLNGSLIQNIIHLGQFLKSHTQDFVDTHSMMLEGRFRSG